jgi:hypothetical protein
MLQFKFNFKNSCLAPINTPFGVPKDVSSFKDLSQIEEKITPPLQVFYRLMTDWALVACGPASCI